MGNIRIAYASDVGRSLTDTLEKGSRMQSIAREVALPAGVQLLPLEMHTDDRGTFTELFRQSWRTDIQPVQWNAVRSEAGVMRGVHVHIRHDDYLIVLQGQASIGLRDLRRGSATEGLTSLVPMSGENLSALTIPRGVAHGFYFHEPSLHIYSVSHYWDLADELACFWADPALGILWPMTSVMISERDGSAPMLSELITQLEPCQPIGASARQAAT